MTDYPRDEVETFFVLCASSNTLACLLRGVAPLDVRRRSWSATHPSSTLRHLQSLSTSPLWFSAKFRHTQACILWWGRQISANFPSNHRCVQRTEAEGCVWIAIVFISCSASEGHLNLNLRFSGCPPAPQWVTQTFLCASVIMNPVCHLVTSPNRINSNLWFVTVVAIFYVSRICLSFPNCSLPLPRVLPSPTPCSPIPPFFSSPYSFTSLTLFFPPHFLPSLLPFFPPPIRILPLHVWLTF